MFLVHFAGAATAFNRAPEQRANWMVLETSKDILEFPGFIFAREARDMSISILVDADACPVKDEIFKTAYRHKTPVVLVANSYLRAPDHPLISMQMVSDGFDAADNWIADATTPKHIVVTADILLAGRCIEAGATVLAPTGKPFNSSNIGGAIATRAIMAELRGGLEQTGGPPPFSAKDRSQFLNALDRELNRLTRLF